MSNDPRRPPARAADGGQGPGSRPRRVLFVNHTAALGGGEIALFHLVTRLNSRRFEPSVLLLADGPLRERLAAAGVRVEVLPAPTGVVSARKDALGGRTLLKLGQVGATAALVCRLAAAIRRHRPDVVHTNSLKADVVGGAAAKLAGVPVAWHVRDRIADDYLPGSVVRAFRALARVVPDLVIANSEATRQTLLAGVGEGSTFARRVRVAHDGTVPPPGVPEPRRPGPPRVGLVGRIAPWKGQHVFLRAAAAVRRVVPDARFVVVGAALFGETAYEAEVRRLASELGLDGAVEFAGFRTDVPDLVAALDVLVHASVTGEPFGQVVIEGMAAAKPVVATAGGGVPEVVVDGSTGLLVPMGDPDAMSVAIARLLADPAAAAEMGRRGRLRVLDRFTVDHAARRVEEVLSILCTSRH